MKQDVNEGVIHFTCGNCQTHLTVAVSLSGIEGPCPSCGALISAPSSSADFLENQQVAEHRARQPIPVPPAPRIRIRRSSTSESPVKQTRRNIDPGGSYWQHQSMERESVMQLLKILGAVLVVALIVIGVVFWLKSQF